jgi:hypothetical protein
VPRWTGRTGPEAPKEQTGGGGEWNVLRGGPEPPSRRAESTQRSYIDTLRVQLQTHLHMHTIVCA